MSAAEAAPRIELLTKPGCHLCDVAREVIDIVCAESGDDWIETSIEDDPALYDEYWEKIPVVLVDGRPHEYWRVNPERLRAALREPAVR
ncbi:MAG: glutaredoxin family protein [Actinomycetes bacterium]